MTIQEIKKAVDEGKKVCWARNHYQVVKDSLGQYLIVHVIDRDCIGLTNQAGDKLNGKEEEFYVHEG
jgi:hypothetical protein